MSIFKRKPKVAYYARVRGAFSMVRVGPFKTEAAARALKPEDFGNCSEVVRALGFDVIQVNA